MFSKNEQLRSLSKIQRKGYKDSENIQAVFHENFSLLYFPKLDAS